MFTEHPNTQAFDLFLCRIQHAFIPSEINSHKEMWMHRNKPDGLEIKGQVDDVCLNDTNSLLGLRSGAGIMKLINLQVSTDGQFDWSSVPFRPIKLSVSA